MIFNLAGMADGMVAIYLHRSFMAVANYLELSVPGKILAFFRMVSDANTTSGLAVRRSFKCCYTTATQNPKFIVFDDPEVI